MINNCIWCKGHCKLDCAAKINKMKRQFKHVQSQDVVECMGNGYYMSIFTQLTAIPRKYIENTNDWVEIIAKPEYTILSFYNSSIGGTTKENPVHPDYIWREQTPNKWSRFVGGKFVTTAYFTDHILNNKDYLIHSVRRESDGEIFTIGEEYNFKGYEVKKSLLTQITIRPYSPNDLRMWAKYTICEASAYNLENVIKIKQKEWEITAYQNHVSKVIINKQLNSIAEQELLSGDITRFSIYSVRRKSDDEIFTVGDKVRLNFNISSIVKSIKKIAIEKVGACPEKLYIYTDGEQSTINNYVKVQPKEWEITAFKNDKGDLKTLQNDGLYHFPADFTAPTTLEFELTTQKSIYSVRRLSDNVEFKIGDVFKIAPASKIANIYSFKLETDNKITVSIDKKHTHCLPYLHTLQKVEKLFTTEDNVDIFEGDRFWFVKIKPNKSIDKEWVVSTPFPVMFVYEPEYDKYFSTKEKAREYVLMNKPCLSVSDVLLLREKNGWFSKDSLIELVKTKL